MPADAARSIFSTPAVLSKVDFLVQLLSAVSDVDSAAAPTRPSRPVRILNIGPAELLDCLAGSTTSLCGLDIGVRQREAGREIPP